MANMSYCRFQNTEKDMDSCIEALTDRNITNDDEKRAAKRMLLDMINFLEEENIIEGCDFARLEIVLKECEVK